MDIPEEFKDFNIGKDPDLEDKIGQPNENTLVYSGSRLPILAPGKAIRVRKEVSQPLNNRNITFLKGALFCTKPHTS